MKLTTLLIAQTLGAGVKSQPDASALLQLRKLSVLSGNNVSRLHESSTSCDRTELGEEILDLENDKKSKQNGLDTKKSELAVRQSLVAVTTTSISNSQTFLQEQTVTLQQRQGAVQELNNEIAETRSKLEGYKTQKVGANKVLTDAKSALTAAQAAEKTASLARRNTFVEWKGKVKKQQMQKITVESASTAVTDAHAVFTEADTSAKTRCQTAQVRRSESDAAVVASEKAASELKKATAAYESAVSVRDQRKSDKDAAEKVLKAATNAKTLASAKKVKECGEAKAADENESSAEGKYLAKKRVCQLAQKEEERLIALQESAQTAYDSASRAAGLACKANGDAKFTLESAEADLNISISILTDNLDSQSVAVASEKLECDQAKVALSVVTKTTQELDAAYLVQTNANEDSQQADQELIWAEMREKGVCNLASDAQSKMTVAKGKSDAAKVLYDKAVADRKSQEVVVAEKKQIMEAAKSSMETGLEELKASQQSHEAAGKAKNEAVVAETNAFQILKAAKWKLSESILHEGGAKEHYDNAVVKVTCVEGRLKTAEAKFEISKANLTRAEETQEICEKKVTSPETKKSDQVLKKLRVAYDELEVQQSVYKVTKSNRDDIAIEKERKTKHMLEMKTIYETAVKETARLTKERDESQKSYNEKVKAHADATAAYNAAKSHMDSWQTQYRLRVEAYNYAVEVYNEAVQYLSELVAAENAARADYEAAKAYWENKVTYYEDAAAKCKTAGEQTEAAEAASDAAGEAFAEAKSTVASLESRLVVERQTYESEKSHCSFSYNFRVQRDKAVAQSKTIVANAEAAVKAAQAAAEAAATAKTDADKRKAELKKALGDAKKAAKVQVTASETCDDEEDKLHKSWIAADAKAEAEQKQCANAAISLAKAKEEFQKATTAYDAASLALDDASDALIEAEEAMKAAAAVAAAAKLTAEKSHAAATAQEKLCTEETAHANQMKTDWESAVENLKTQEAFLVTCTTEAAAGQKAVSKSMVDLKSAQQKRAAASGAVTTAQAAVDEIDVCIDTETKNESSLTDKLPQTQGFVDSAKAIVAAEQQKLSDKQTLLVSYQADVKSYEQAVQTATAALNAVIKELYDKEMLLATCLPSRCDPPQDFIAHWNEEVPNLLHGTSWTPTCKEGFKPDFCCDATHMTCTDGKLEPPTFGCAPVLTGTLEVNIMEGNGLWFQLEEYVDGENENDHREFGFHNVPGDPFVVIELCPGPGAASQTQQTSVKYDSYNPDWRHEAPMMFHLNEASDCNSFRIGIRDDRTDDENMCWDKAMNFIGGVDLLAIKDGKAVAEFMKAPNEKVTRRVVTESGTLDLEYTWFPDVDGPIRM